MFLKPENYTFNRALNYSICFDHWRETQVGSLGHRIVHFMIGAVEFIPIIGQIASLFETAIASVMLTPSTPPTSNCSLNGQFERNKTPPQSRLGDEKIPKRVEAADSAETPPTPALRNRAAFLSYQERQQRAGSLVDLIVGRGQKGRDYPYYPRLGEKRYDLNGNTYSEYTPLTLDRSREATPDCEADFTSLKGMEFIPDNSLDDIYLERLFPPVLLRRPEIRLFINAARILKEGGTLVADFNDGESIDEQKRRVFVLNAFFTKYLVPLDAKVAAVTEKNRRNDAHGPSLLVCTKYYKLEPSNELLTKRPIEMTLEFEKMLLAVNPK